ncbi:Fanconi anemia core complex-associated protein 24-like [Ylistrum balloti]|uniref:Fanconi anemia core complex-associated protein 24-like n=1 Tax=Ylistrum balloti TaxID=509963 RepID=UPI002905B280|nr:Fanconi anemia core complex-associated protein 24-like [Ylistrum balloti]
MASQTSVKQTFKVPVGHIVICGKWRGSDLSAILQGGVQVLYEDGLGLIDFYPTGNLGVVYLPEADLITCGTYKRKLAKLRKANKICVLVMAERTSTSQQYYSPLQNFCMLELGFSLLPVPSQREAASLLIQMVHNEGKSAELNPFCKKKKNVHLDPAILTTLQCVPKLGEVKAKLLLQTFKNIQNISVASVEELAAVVGKASAAQVKTFFSEGVT